MFSLPAMRSTQGSLGSTLTISKFSTHPNQQHVKMAVTRGCRGADPEALAAIPEIQQMNKKRLHEEEKAQEEEERAEKAASQTGADVEMKDGDAQGTVATSSREIHEIMGGTKASEDNDDTCSPPPKRSSWSKSSSCCNANKESPLKLQEQSRLPIQLSFSTPMYTPIPELFWTLPLPSRRRRPSRISQSP